MRETAAGAEQLLPPRSPVLARPGSVRARSPVLPESRALDEKVLALEKIVLGRSA